MSGNDNTEETTNEDTRESIPVNRRSVLKKLGAAGVVGALGVPATASADTTASDAHVEEVLNTPQVTRIREEIGTFTVENATVKRIEKAGTRVTLTEIETDLGTLTNTEIGSTVGAEFELDLSRNPSLHKTLPDGFGPISAESTVLLQSDESASTFVRKATDDELAQLEQAVGDTVVTAVYASHINGFGVITGTVSDEQTDIQRYRVVTNGGGISAAAVEPVIAPRGCVATCGVCALAALEAGLCVTSCAGVLAFGVGLPSCIICIIGSKFATFLSCDKCSDCIF